MIKIGAHSIWGDSCPCVLDNEQLARHTYILGKTGTGKSTLLSNILIQQIVNGEGDCLIDQHGDIADQILEYIPPGRIDEAIYVDVADAEYPVSFNPIANVPKHQRPMVVSGVLNAFKGVWSDSWGPRMEYILTNAITSLICCENVSLMCLNRLLVDSAYRQWVIKQIDDPLVVRFWTDEYEAYDSRFRTEAIAPIQNKIGQFFNNPVSRNILGQVRSRITPRDIMDQRKVVIINLSKGKVGEECSHLLGALIAQSFQTAALSRSEKTEESRWPFLLAIDEFQNFTTDSIATILSEARKYGLWLMLSHQYIGQLPEKISAAIFGNVGTMITFSVGASDGEVLVNEFSGSYARDQFVDLNKYEALYRQQKGASLSSTGRMYTYPLGGIRHSVSDKIRKNSRDCYCTPRTRCEGKLNRWLKF